MCNTELVLHSLKLVSCVIEDTAQLLLLELIRNMLLAAVHGIISAGENLFLYPGMQNIHY